MTISVLRALLRDLPIDWCVSDVYVGANWLLSLLTHPDGSQRAGVATAPLQIDAGSPYQIGHYRMDEDACVIARLLLSDDPAAAGIGLATINALNQPEEGAFVLADAANWLTERCQDRNVAIFGRFPFIDAEVRPFARQVWVFEQQPHPDEFDSSAISVVLPQAELVAVTGSALVNHSIDLILPQIKPESTVILLGPSTPLSPQLFDCGIDAMFGVRVIDLTSLIDSVVNGAGFQKIHGLQRVALIKPTMS
ncbi:MAG: DUF364 domain-containing protein [Anaerolineae bacterium]